MVQQCSTRRLVTRHRLFRSKKYRLSRKKRQIYRSFKG